MSLRPRSWLPHSQTECWFRTVLLLLSISTATVAATTDRAPCAPTPQPESRAKKGTPNLILIVADDLDETLGGPQGLPVTQELIGAQGATMENWFAHTPICCPSRAQLLSSRYFHNIKVARKAPSPQNHTCHPACRLTDPSFVLLASRASRAA